MHIIFLFFSVFQLNMTHAHLHQTYYDEVINEIGSDGETGGWVYARQGEAYGTIPSKMHPCRLQVN